MLQVVQQLAGLRLLFGMVDPDFGQALIGRQLSGHAREKFALHAGADALLRQRIGPEPGQGEVGSGVRRSMGPSIRARHPVNPPGNALSGHAGALHSAHSQQPVPSPYPSTHAPRT